MQYTAKELLESNPGITYRQLDYWVRNGHVAPMSGTGVGTGTSRYFSSEESRVICVMADLVELGVLPWKAAHMARTYVADKSVSLTLNHVQLTLSPKEKEEEDGSS